MLVPPPSDAPPPPDAGIYCNCMQWAMPIRIADIEPHKDVLGPQTPARTDWCSDPRAQIAFARAFSQPLLDTTTARE